MNICIDESTLSEFSIPRVRDIPELHKELRRMGLSFDRAWAVSSMKQVSLDMVSSIKGDVCERWWKSKQYVVLRIAVPNKKGPRYHDATADLDEEQQIMLKACRIRY